MIGLSVSLCIAEMANGTVDPATVTRIIGGTAARTRSDWDQVVNAYRGLWGNQAGTAEELLRAFVAEGRIEQPRLDRKNPKVPIHFDGTKGAIWVQREEDIFYRPYNR